MLHISAHQMHVLQQSQLSRIKRDIASELTIDYPSQAEKLGDKLGEFVRDSIEAARTVWIDETPQVHRFVKSLFILEYVMEDEVKVKAFAKVMMSEPNAEARLLFVEKNFL